MEEPTLFVILFIIFAVTAGCVPLIRLILQSKNRERRNQEEQKNRDLRGEDCTAIVREKMSRPGNENLAMHSMDWMDAPAEVCELVLEDPNGDLFTAEAEYGLYVRCKVGDHLHLRKTVEEGRLLVWAPRNKSGGLIEVGQMSESEITGMKDPDFISDETHELNHVLKKYQKRQTKRNRNLLLRFLSAFRADETYKPHNRRDFYRYVEDTQCFDNMENSRR